MTPHASFLALRYAPHAAVGNLVRLTETSTRTARGGFYDAIDVGTGEVSQRYLSLDQGMVMAALGNELADHDLRSYVSSGAMQRRVRPLMAHGAVRRRAPGLRALGFPSDLGKPAGSPGL